MRPLSKRPSNSHLRQSFSCIPVEVGDIEPEWAMFKASIAEAAAQCHRYLKGAATLKHPGGHRWSGKPSDWRKRPSGMCYPRGLLRQLQGTNRPEGQQHQPWRRQSSGCGREFGDAMEKDFWPAPKHFWKTVRHLRRGKRGTIQAVYSKDETLLTSTGKGDRTVERTLWGTPEPD